MKVEFRERFCRVKIVVNIKLFLFLGFYELLKWRLFCLKEKVE